jgi:BatD DUF11 like domain
MKRKQGKYILNMFFGLAVLMFAQPLLLSAQDISIQAVLKPNQAKVGQHVQLVVSIEGKANLRSAPQLPPLPDFQVYGGGRSSNFSFVNGQVSSVLQFTYIMVPKRAGQFTIGPISLEYKGKTYATKPRKMMVTGAAQGYSPPQAARQRQAQRPQPQSQAAPAGAVKQGGSKAVFVTTSVDRRSVYVNEPVILTFRWYSRIQTLSQPQYNAPDTSGFWAEDLPPQREYMTHIEGKEYKVVEIRQVLFPTTSGKLTIGPAELTVQVQDFKRQVRDPLSDTFFRNFFSTGQRVALQSKPIAVQVLPIPSVKRPGDFTGTVGKWSLSASLDRTEAKVGEAVTLEVRLFGQGNVKSVGKPQLPPLTGFKVYETVSSSEVQKKADTIQGVKIYRTLLRPEVTGTLSIPPIAYSYFDPRKKKFEQVKVPSLHLKVFPGEAQEQISVVGSTQQVSGTGVKIVAQDVRYLKTEIPLYPEAAPLPPLFWIVGFLFPPLVLLGFWTWQKQRDRLAADPRYARKITAGRSAQRALKQARSARLRRDPKAFYSALAQALVNYLADELGASRSGITQRELLHQLQTRGADEKLLAELSVLFDETDFARFAPSEREAMAMTADEQKAIEILTQLSRVLRK